MEFSLFRGILLLQGTFCCAIWLGALLRVSRAAVYTNDWAVGISAGEEAAKRIAEKHGLTNLGQVGGEREREGLDRSHSPAVAECRSKRWNWKQKAGINKSMVSIPGGELIPGCW